MSFLTRLIQCLNNLKSIFKRGLNVYISFEKRIYRLSQVIPLAGNHQFMYTYSKDGIVVSTVLDSRTINKEGKYPIKVKVYHQRKPKYYSIGICLTKGEWDKLAESKSSESKKIRQAIESSFSLVRMNVEALAEKGTFSFNTLNLRLGKATGDTLNSAIRAKVIELENEERIGTMQFYKTTLVMVEEVGGKDIPFSAITVEWLQKCERLWSTSRSIATIGMHMRNIRTLMNEAKRAGFIKESQYPFGKGKYEIKTGVGRKKGLTKKQLKAIFDYVSENETTNRYKDLWMFIYLCNGINPTDMLNLKFSDIVEGEICYVRQKTMRTTKSRKEIRAVVSPQLQEIINKWGNKPLPDNYIFPYLKGNETAIDKKAVTRDVVKRINKRMKLIGEELGIGNITTYTARHSFATVLKRSGANISYISESLGHTDQRTTEVYLASFEREERDKNTNLLTSFL